LIFLSPLIIYTYFRIRTLIAHSRSKNIFTAFFILLVLAFPLAETVSHNSGNGLVIYLIFSDLIIAAFQIVKIISPEKLRDPRTRFFRLFLVLMFPLAK